MTKTDFQLSDFDSLTTIGLTKSQAHCYSLLNKSRGLTAAGISEQLSLNRTTTYRILTDLRDKGFINESHLIGATKYYAVPLLIAMAHYADYQRRQIADAIIKQQSK